MFNFKHTHSEKVVVLTSQHSSYYPMIIRYDVLDLFLTNLRKITKRKISHNKEDLTDPRKELKLKVTQVWLPEGPGYTSGLETRMEQFLKDTLSGTKSQPSETQTILADVDFGYKVSVNPLCRPQRALMSECIVHVSSRDGSFPWPLRPCISLNSHN